MRSLCLFQYKLTKKPIHKTREKNKTTAYVPEINSQQRLHQHHNRKCGQQGLHHPIAQPFSKHFPSVKCRSPGQLYVPPSAAKCRDLSLDVGIFFVIFPCVMTLVQGLLFQLNVGTLGQDRQGFVFHDTADFLLPRVCCTP